MSNAMADKPKIMAQLTLRRSANSFRLFCGDVEIEGKYSVQVNDTPDNGGSCAVIVFQLDKMHFDTERVPANKLN